MKKILFIFLAVFALNANAQIPPGYYNPAAGLTGPSLQLALHNIIKSHTVVSYASLWTHFQQTDKKTSGKVWDMYSDVPGGTPAYQFTFISDQCGSYGGEGDCYNREHSWPQSWFASATTPSSDLFHLYPTDGYVNNRRGNYPYGDVDSAYWTSSNGSKLGFCSDPGFSGAVFEPIDEYKGDFARSYFYMSTRYLSEDGAWATSPGTNKSIILPWLASVLLQWNHLDPVSTKETARNNVVYNIQDNRNPFIDHPEWADSIWVMITTGIEKPAAAEDLSIQVYPNPVNEIMYISNAGAKNLKVKLSVMNALGQTMEEHTNIELNALGQYEINCSGWSKGMYYVSVMEEEMVKVIRFVKL